MFKIPRVGLLLIKGKFKHMREGGGGEGEGLLELWLID